jgi:integrase
LPRTTTPTLRDFSAEWLEAQHHSGKARGTIDNYRSALDRWIVPQLGELHLSSIGKREVFQFTNYLAEKTGPVNRSNVYSIMRVIMHSAVEDFGYLPAWTVSVRGVGGDKSTPRPEFTFEQATAVIARMPQRYQDALSVTLGAALRVSELVGLNAGDWNPETGALTISRQFYRGKVTQTKTGVVADVYPLSFAADILNGIHEERGSTISLWESPTFRGKGVGGRLSTVAMREAWGTARRWARVPDIHLHDLRHVGLTQLARIPGASLADIQAHGRHRDPKSTMRYLHAAEGTRRRNLSAAWKANAEN